MIRTAYRDQGHEISPELLDFFRRCYMMGVREERHQWNMRVLKGSSRWHLKWEQVLMFAVVWNLGLAALNIWGLYR